MNRADRMRARLEQIFKPNELDITDQSHLHAGHASSQPEGETHYRIRIRAACFGGQSRVTIQRSIMQALQAEFDTGLHALSLDAQGD